MWEPLSLDPLCICSLTLELALSVGAHCLWAPCLKYFGGPCNPKLRHCLDLLIFTLIAQIPSPFPLIPYLSLTLLYTSYHTSTVFFSFIFPTHISLALTHAPLHNISILASTTWIYNLKCLFLAHIIVTSCSLVFSYILSNPSNLLPFKPFYIYFLI